MWHASVYKIENKLFGGIQRRLIASQYFGDEVECIAFTSRFRDLTGFVCFTADIGHYPNHPVEIDYQRRMAERADRAYREQFELDPDAKFRVGRRGQPINIESDDLPF